MTRHLVGVGVLATTADAATTWLAFKVAAVHAGLVFMEVNPLVASAMEAVGPVAALAGRMLAGVVMVGFLGWAARRTRWGRWPLGLAAAGTSAVVGWNVWMLQAVLPVA